MMRHAAPPPRIMMHHVIVLHSRRNHIASCCAGPPPQAAFQWCGCCWRPGPPQPATAASCALPAPAGCVPVVRMLLAAGAKAGAAVAGGFTALHIAAESGNMEVVELLLQVRAPPDASRELGVVLKRCTSQPSRAAHAEVAELLL